MMRKKMTAFAGALLVADLLLAACQDKPSQPTATSEAPVPVADSSADTLKRVRTPGSKVPFVAPTKIGRVLGEKSPSPPASR
ncbi:hypothetical protein [Hymenobacter properus]|uniref:Uncharacterized protein n=1 Tax=Hymenobacter properus TaxID=2791026 RepID=A0A931BBX5_9BACT|nr:hypothetical protein [Hymenobacter properus]MBF9141035.1 hypothetical protein [Hymenobacter properus]MBR7719844.1 hypothetical protein [Microvirga sp. SRT04]